VPFESLTDAPTSDVGFVASGATLEECFRSAADATLAVMVADPANVRPIVQRRTNLRRESLDMLLVAFLEEIVFFKDAESLFLRLQTVTVGSGDGAWHLEATWAGETIDPRVHILSGDVKAVTLHRLSIFETDNGWQATVVLDV